MKRLVLFLTLAFLLVAGSAFSATVNCIMYSSENDGDSGEAGYRTPITSDYTFTIETDDMTGEVIAFTDLFSNYFFANEAGGWNTDDSAPFDLGEQIFKNGVTYNVAEITFDGDTTGGDEHGLWFYRSLMGPGGGPWGSSKDGIIAINFDGTDGEVILGVNEILNETYIFHAVPLPAAGWLLMSGLLGFLGFRKKFQKEAS